MDEQLSPTTAREYRRLESKLITPALGGVPLRRVTTQRLDAFYASLARDRQLVAGVDPPCPRRAPGRARSGRALGVDPRQPRRQRITAQAAPSRDHPAGDPRHPGAAHRRRRAGRRASAPCSACSPRPAPAVARYAGCGGRTSMTTRRRSASAAPSPRSPAAPSSRTPRPMPPARSPSMLERSRSSPASATR